MGTMTATDRTAAFHARLTWRSLDVAHPVEGAMVLTRMADGRVVVGFYQPAKCEWWHRPGIEPGEVKEWADMSPAMAWASERN